MLSYVEDIADTNKKLENVMKTLSTFLREVGIQVNEEKFTTLVDLEAQLALYSHVIVFCNKSYTDHAEKQNPSSDDAAAAASTKKSTKTILGIVCRVIFIWYTRAKLTEWQ